MEWKHLARGLRPNSPAAFAFAVACVGVASGVRGLVSLWGQDILPFAAHFPAVLIAAWLAGAAAGALATALSIFVIWFVFTPPYWAASPLTAHEITNYSFFALSCVLIVWIAESNRRAFLRLDKQDGERRLLLGELEHRGRNTFAIVQAIVTQSLEGQRDLAKTIVGRIRTVSSTNDVVTNSPTKSVEFSFLLKRELDAFGISRYALDGPNFEVEAELARSIALVSHELVTNAMKYGALSNATGRVTVSWTRKDDDVQIEWEESGGPEVSTPTKRGFGSHLIGRMLQNHRGTVSNEFRPAGLRCRLTFRLS